MGTGAPSLGWTWDYQMAEIEWRKAGGRLDGMMAVAHYAAMSYPARVLGDRELWPKLRDRLLAYYQTEANEESLVAQWEPCVLYDQTDRLPACRVPLHVIAFDQDVQAPPEDGKEVVDLCPRAEYHLFEGMGHCSIYGHTHDVLNPFIKRDHRALSVDRPTAKEAAMDVTRYGTFIFSSVVRGLTPWRLASAVTHGDRMTPGETPSASPADRALATGLSAAAATATPISTVSSMRRCRCSSAQG